MKQLNSELKFLLLSTIAGVPAVALNRNWNELKEDIKQSVYEIVIESVLDNDRQLVAATLLNALRDGSVRRDEWGEIVKT